MPKRTNRVTPAAARRNARKGERYRKVDKLVAERSAGTCPDCGKQRYLDRDAARAYGRREFPDSIIRAYRCGRYWHFTTQPTGRWTRHRDRD